GLVVRNCGIWACQAARQAHTALIKKDNIEMFCEARRKGGSVPFRAESKPRRSGSTRRSNEHAFACAGRGQHCKSNVKRPRIARGKMIQRDCERDTGECG